MTRRPLFWLALVVVSLASAAFAYRYFPSAFPLVSLDIAMDRETALAAARRLADEHHLGPAGFRQAASFGGDTEAQTFIELEGGGKDAFARMLEQRLYAAYTWRVRHFKAGETREVLFRFTPDGQPYGFSEEIKEDAPGASLTPEAARAIAEARAPEWRVDLGAFRLVEQSREVRPGGRVDHSFVYERPDRRLNEGRYRLRLTVSGDRLTDVTHFIKVPEAFTRRFQQMRSANTAITFGSSIAALLLYVVGGMAIGLFFLLRQRWVVWRQPVAWGVFVAALQVLAALNQWPLVWMEYDTALSTASFVAQRLAMLVASFVGLAVLLSLSFMAAESLTRRAFPQQPQLWRLWSRHVASSRGILGRTLAGYLLVGVFFAYEVALYFLSTRLLGWWTPSDLLFHPDVLATYLPWLTAIAVSFQAGFWEECLFRAVPLAGAALIGERLGHRRAWLVAAFIVQAIVFGAGHAAYATQPAYARLVELIIPSIAFGLLYLKLGLLPSVILHFVFDVSWFALPLFVSSAPGVWVDRTMVVVLTLVPVWVVVWQSRRTGGWRELDPSDLNGAWVPPAVVPVPVERVARPPVEEALRPAVAKVMIAAGVAGAVVWAVSAPFGTEIPVFSTERRAAATAARRILSERQIPLPEAWRILPAARDGQDQAHRFVWETAGRERYFELLGSYLDPPHWQVRIVTFEGDVAERAEEWQVFVGVDGAVQRVQHELPESRAGATLAQAQAREVARGAVRDRFGLDPTRLKEVSAAPAKLPARTDWVFTFTEATIKPLPQGEPRLSVTIAGSEVVDARRFVHVPEEWQRQERNERTILRVLNIGRVLVLISLLFASGVAAIVAWSRRNFARRFFVTIFVVAWLIDLVQLWNGWPAIIAQFPTAQPLRLQILIAVGAALVGATLSDSLVGLASGITPRWAARLGTLPANAVLGLGLALGALASGVRAAVATMRAWHGPVLPSFSGADSYVPLVGAAVDAAGGYLLVTIVVLLLAAGLDRWTRGWTRYRVLAVATLAVAGLVLGGNTTETAQVWLASGAATALLLVMAYVAVVRFDVSVVPLAVATMMICDRAREGLYRAYPGALPGGVLGIVVIGLLAYWWCLALRDEPARQVSG